MKKKLVVSAMLVCLLALGLSLLGCPTDGGDDPSPSFVAVTSISGVPTSGVKNTALTLTGTVNPADATNKTIAWSVKSGSATISGNSLTASAAGEVVVTATIVNGLTANSNYTQDYNITITDGGGFVAVASITGIPTGGVKNTDITLTGTVNPSNATNKTIAWSVKSAGTTGATITDGNKLNTTAAGEVVVTATIVNGSTASSNYTQDFNITIADSFVQVSSISGVPASGTVGDDLTLTGTVNPNNATNKTIAWSVKTAGITGATIADGNKLNTTAAGEVIVTATIVNGLTSSSNYTEDFNITFTGGGGGGFIPVNSITNVPTYGGVGTHILTGTVNPSNATNQTIVWSVVLSQGTGATISGNTLNTTSAGTPRVRATIVNGSTESSDFTQDFALTITVGGVSGIDNWPVLLGKWKWQEGSYNIQLEFKTGQSMGGYTFTQSHDLPGSQGGGSIFACSYIETTLRKYDPETKIIEQTFTVTVSGDGQTVTFSDYQDPEGEGDYSYLNGRTYTKQP